MCADLTGGYCLVILAVNLRRMRSITLLKKICYPISDQSSQYAFRTSRKQTNSSTSNQLSYSHMRIASLQASMRLEHAQRILFLVVILLEIQVSQTELYNAPTTLY